MKFEVELKFIVTDRDAVRAKLVALGGRPDPVHAESDTYLGHPARSFAETDEALRVRESGGHVMLTYKGPKIDRTTKTRREIEVAVAPEPGAAASMIELLDELGFEPVRVVRKSREIFRVPCEHRVVHASLDHVERLGDFLELELTARPEQVAESRQLLTRLAAQIGLSRPQRRSYLELLLEQDATISDTAPPREDWFE